MNAANDTPADQLQAMHRLADHRLPAEQAAALRDTLSPAALETVADWQQQREQLRRLHASLEHEPVPSALRAAAEQLQARQRSHRHWGRWGGMAASLLLAFGLGWGMHGHWHGGSAAPPGGAADGLATSAPLAFAQQAAAAYAVFQPEKRHPVEVPAAEQDHLVRWLSNRLGRSLTVPVLDAQGFELVGGRLLPGSTGARGQFMYEDAAGQRITLYLGAVAQSAATAETAFEFHSEAGVASFYWLDQGFGYALSGNLPRAGLLTLATAVHAQLQPMEAGQRIRSH